MTFFSHRPQITLICYLGQYTLHFTHFDFFTPNLPNFAKINLKVGP